MYPAGVIAADDPVQGDASNIAEIQFKNFTIHPLATYDVEARVVMKNSYWFDSAAEISPLDFALAWGEVSDQAVQDKLSLYQGGRFLNYRIRKRGALPISYDVINAHIANTHLIPADDSIREQLQAVRQGEFIHLSGYLIEASKPGGWSWRSSLSRTDTGPGACEIMFVKNVTAPRRIRAIPLNR